MTVPPQAPIRRFEDIEEVFELLRSEGHRVTTPCRIVLEALFAAEGPVSAPHITRTTALTESDVGSVYRNLERLERLGVVAHVHLGHGPSLYTLIGAGGREFMVCERCDRVRDVDPTELDPIRQEIERRFGYRAHFGHFPIVGICSDCLASGWPPDAKAEYAHSHGDYVHSHAPHGGAGREHTHDV